VGAKSIAIVESKGRFLLGLVAILVLLAIMPSALEASNGVKMPFTSKMYRDVEDEQRDAAYFTVETDELLVREDAEKANVLVVTSFEALVEALKSNPQIRLIYFHPDTLRNIDAGWLKEEYGSGKVLAALDTAISGMTQKLGITPQLEDFRPENSMGRVGVSVVQLLDNEKMRTEGYHHYQDFFADFEQVHIALRKVFLLESIPPGPTPLGIGQWTDSYGTLTGNTWFNHESSGGFVWHYGHAYSSYNHTPYWIRVRADTYNTCGGYHQISSKDVATYNYPFINTGDVLAGSNQCPGQSSMTIYVYGTYQVQRFSWNPAKQTGYTSEQKSVPTPN
jgi:hypothetical protein